MLSAHFSFHAQKVISHQPDSSSEGMHMSMSNVAIHARGIAQRHFPMEKLVFYTVHRAMWREFVSEAIRMNADYSGHFYVVPSTVCKVLKCTMTMAGKFVWRQYPTISTYREKSIEPQETCHYSQKLRKT